MQPTYGRVILQHSINAPSPDLLAFVAIEGLMLIHVDLWVGRLKY